MTWLIAKRNKKGEVVAVKTTKAERLPRQGTPDEHVDFSSSLTWHYRCRRNGGTGVGLTTDALSVQSGRRWLDHNLWDEHKACYFKAIQAGVCGNYHPVMQLTGDIVPD